MHCSLYRNICFAIIFLITACSAPKDGILSKAGPLEEVSFSCPAEGTRTQKLGSAAVITWLKPDPSDPVVCRTIDNRKVETQWLYGLYSLPTVKMQEKRAAIAAAFRGAPQEVCFTQIVQPANSVGYSADVNSSYLYEHCWKQAGRTTINVDGKPTSVIAIIQTDEGRAGNYFAADRTLYYDPASKLFVQVDVNNRRGNPISGYRLSVITRPKA